MKTTCLPNIVAMLAVITLAEAACESTSAPGGGTGGMAEGGAFSMGGNSGGAREMSACTGSEMCKDKGLPYCDTEHGKCVACLTRSDCPVGKPECVQGACIRCDADGVSPDVCGGTTPICGAKGECVECKASVQCGMANKPICNVAAGICEGCVGSSQCANKPGAGKFCNTGTMECVSCLTSTDCPTDAPACTTSGKCEKCDNGNAPKDACSQRGDGAPVCGPAGLCVECTANASQACVGSKPVCDANVCRRCANDNECTGKGPAVCMDHDDGRCATDAETVTVQGENLQSAVDQVALGAKKVVVFSVGVGAARFSGPGTLVLVGKGEQAFVMQTSVDLDAPPALTLTGGTTYARGFQVKRSSGGVLIDGAAFDFRNLMIGLNGTGKFGLARWSGILVNNPGTPAKMRNVSILSLSSWAMLCSEAIDINASVMVTGNSTSTIDPICYP